MLDKLIGQTSTVGVLKDGLDASSARVRAIAHRVATASVDGGGFAGALEQAGGGEAAKAVDLEKEMVALADEQLRFDAAAKLLQKVYAQIRTSIRER